MTVVQLKPRSQNEDDHQKAYFKWLRLAHPEAYDLTLAIPNGGKRAVKEAAKLRMCGVRAGVPDIFMAKPVLKEKEEAKDEEGNVVAWRSYMRPGLWIEMKVPGKLGKRQGIVTPQQQSWHLKLAGQGYAMEVCYGWDEAREVTNKYLRGEI